MIENTLQNTARKGVLSTSQEVVIAKNCGYDRESVCEAWKHGRGNVVAAGNVIAWPAEDFVDYLLLMDFFGGSFERAIAQILQQVAESRRVVDVPAGRNPVHQQLLA